EGTSGEVEMSLCLADDSIIPAKFSRSALSRDNSSIGLLITDLTSLKQQLEFTARLQAVQDEERRRIARELHDSVGQLLVAIGMNLDAIKAEAGRLGAGAVRAISDNESLVDQAASEIRTISYLLHPPLLDVVGLASTLRSYVDGFSE